jgi:hypothetical protein
MADLTVGPDDMRVAVSKEQVKDAPNIEREGDELFSPRLRCGAPVPGATEPSGLRGGLRLLG